MYKGRLPREFDEGFSARLAVLMFGVTIGALYAVLIGMVGACATPFPYRISPAIRRAMTGFFYISSGRMYVRNTGGIMSGI
jgi:hypothetical protein